MTFGHNSVSFVLDYDLIEFVKGVEGLVCIITCIYLILLTSRIM